MISTLECVQTNPNGENAINNQKLQLISTDWWTSKQLHLERFEIIELIFRADVALLFFRSEMLVLLIKKRGKRSVDLPRRNHSNRNGQNRGLCPTKTALLQLALPPVNCRLHSRNRQILHCWSPKECTLLEIVEQCYHSVPSYSIAFNPSNAQWFVLVR